MKKRIFAMAAAVLVIAALLVGCGSSVDTLEGTTWEITSMTYNGQEIDVSQMASAIGATDGFTVSFGENGEGTAEAMGQSQTFTYEYKDGKLITEGESFDVNGDTIVMEMDGASMTLKKK
jgi:ABC-type glycerol-3-phosphate transport system substrate-binding protein